MSDCSDAGSCSDLNCGNIADCAKPLAKCCPPKPKCGDEILYPPFSPPDCCPVFDCCPPYISIRENCKGPPSTRLPCPCPPKRCDLICNPVPPPCCPELRPCPGLRPQPCPGPLRVGNGKPWTCCPGPRRGGCLPIGPCIGGLACNCGPDCKLTGNCGRSDCTCPPPCGRKF